MRDSTKSLLKLCLVVVLIIIIIVLTIIFQNGDLTTNQAQSTAVEDYYETKFLWAETYFDEGQYLKAGLLYKEYYEGTKPAFFEKPKFKTKIAKNRELASAILYLLNQ